ncbi:MAG: AzlD domain-containing protein [Nitriliruptorales bacterium]|nr:AzlD domain-containing protein [Nitriliruptorales bacterium]
MTATAAFVALALGALTTWLLRVTFIVFVPADRLPLRVRHALDDVGPAVTAAIVASQLAHGSGPTGLWSLSLVAAAVAGIVAWRTGHLAYTVLAGIGAMAALTVL